MSAKARTLAHVIPVTAEQVIDGQLVIETHCCDYEQYSKLPHVVVYKEKICVKTGWSSDRCYACYKSGLPVATKQ